MISAAMMSVAGTFYGQYVLVLDPERLLSSEISIIVLLMTVLGGSGTLWGPALGAAILIPLSEYSRIWFGGTGRTDRSHHLRHSRSWRCACGGRAAS